jgi:tRNA 2-thiouridine synthesizing protein A
MYEEYYVKFSTIKKVGDLPEQTKPDRTLDCLGLYCPEPVFRVRLELDDMKIGQVLEVLADDPAAEEDIKSLCKRLEQELLSTTKEGNTLRFTIRKVE